MAPVPAKAMPRASRCPGLISGGVPAIKYGGQFLNRARGRGGAVADSEGCGVAVRCPTKAAASARLLECDRYHFPSVNLQARPPLSRTSLRGQIESLGANGDREECSKN